MEELINYLAQTMNVSRDVAAGLATQFTMGHLPFAPAFSASNSAVAPTILRGLQNPVKSTEVPPMAHMLPGVPGHAELSTMNPMPKRLVMGAPEGSQSPNNTFNQMHPNHQKVYQSTMDALYKSDPLARAPTGHGGPGIDEFGMTTDTGYAVNGARTGISDGKKVNLKTYTGNEQADELIKHSVGANREAPMRGPPEGSDYSELDKHLEELNKTGKGVYE